MENSILTITDEMVLEYILSCERWTAKSIQEKFSLTPKEVKEILKKPEFIREYGNRLRAGMAGEIPRILRLMMSTLETGKAPAALFKLALEIATDWFDTKRENYEKPPMTPEQYEKLMNEYNEAVRREAQKSLIKTEHEGEEE